MNDQETCIEKGLTKKTYFSMDNFFVALANCLDSGKKVEFQRDEKKLRINFLETGDDVDILHSIRLSTWFSNRKDSNSIWHK